MYERFSPETQIAVEWGRQLARHCGERTVHTGHILYAILVIGRAYFPGLLISNPDLLPQIAERIQRPFPQGLVQTGFFRKNMSKSLMKSIEMSMYFTRYRGSTEISFNDIVSGILHCGPNVATFLLDEFGVDAKCLRTK